MTQASKTLPVLATVRDAYGFVSANLRTLFDLGRGPAVAAVVLGLIFGMERGYDATPLTVMASLLAYAWFSFYVLRLVLLGPARARLPSPSPRAGEGPAPRSALLAGYMLRALGIGAAAMAAFFLLTLVVVVPVTALPTGLGAPDPAAVQPSGAP